MRISDWSSDVCSSDLQTHELPASGPGVDATGTFLGFDRPELFRSRLRATLERVEECYAALFEEEPDLPGPSNLSFSGVEQDPATLAVLGEMGFATPEGAASLVRGWLNGRYRETRSERARTLLTQIALPLLAALARVANPDTALLRLEARSEEQTYELQSKMRILYAVL